MRKLKISLIFVIWLLISCSAKIGSSNEGSQYSEDFAVMETTESGATPTRERSEIIENTITPTILLTKTQTPSPWSNEPDGLQIAEMRDRVYEAGEIKVEQNLTSALNYTRQIVSYRSDGLKIFALMTIPTGEVPETGWPIIVFNHGYITPTTYRTTERYVDYVDQIARNGYIVFKSDYRSHGDSEGDEVIGGGYGTPGYTNDILNAIVSLKQLPIADPNRIGIWGHSMGGQISLRAMVVSEDIKAGVIWGGVVAPYPVVISRWDFRRNPILFPELAIGEVNSRNNSVNNWLTDFSNWVESYVEKYGEPEQNLLYWDTISPNSYLADLSSPIQLHHSTEDHSVPIEWSEILAGELQQARMPYEFYKYEGDNHNISGNFNTAMKRTIEFFDTHVKGQ